MDSYDAVKWIWGAVGIFWLLAAFVRKRTVRRQSIGSRLLQLGIVLLLLVPFLVFSRSLEMLDKNFLSDVPEIPPLGLLLTLIGCGFAVWARIVLGSNWSGTVTVKENHVLITRGPYAWVRHPIYSGFLLALLGTALVLGKLLWLLAAGLALLTLCLKLRAEETFMLETFGQQYASYQQRVKALIPYVL